MYKKIILLLIVFVSLGGFVGGVNAQTVESIDLNIAENQLVYGETTEYEVIASYSNDKDQVVTSQSTVTVSDENLLSINTNQNLLTANNSEGVVVVTATYNNVNSSKIVEINDGYNTYTFGESLGLSLVLLLVGILAVLGGITLVFSSTINIMALGLSIAFTITYLFGFITFGVLLGVFMLNGLTISLSSMITFID